MVTGSRLRRDPLTERAPITALGRDQLERTGLTNLGDALQNLPITGSAPNSQFNVPGNYGFPQDGAGIGAGSVQVSLGDPEVCAATPGCVPFNFFGGQGPDGRGSFTGEMLDFVTYTQRDFSDQTLGNAAFNVTGELFSMPAGEAGIAAGIEYRDHDGSFRPDPIAERGETAGIPSGPTRGGFSVTEYYGELSLPLVDAGGRYWELNLAARNSDYSTFGSEATYKVNTLFTPVESVTLRGSFSTGFRAPGIGELFGGAAREDFLFLDPCADVLGQYGSVNGGRDAPQHPSIAANCASLGVPTSLVQTNPQLSAVSAGSSSLSPETSQYFTAGLVWSTQPAVDWIERFTASVDHYDLRIGDAIQGRDPGDVITACVDTLDGGARMDSALFSDLRLSYIPPLAGDEWTISLGLNNLFDEDPPVCFPCGVNGMSLVVHDLPGRVGYLRVTYNGAADPR